MKYYTPHIDELFIGMECESKQDGEWIPETINKLDGQESIHRRLQYLTTDDIIDEEFDLRYETREFKSFSKILYSNESPVEVSVHLLNHQGEPVIRITKSDEIILDSIIVKNKYEFKWLIERLL